MSANIELKKEVVSEITDKINNSKSVVLVHFAGLTVAEDNAIRAEFRKANVEYKVYKNTLIRKAFDGLGVNDFDSDLNGPTAVAFGNEETDASKTVVETAKKYGDKLAVKSGYIGGTYVDEAGVKKYAAIPSKPELYSMLAGTLSNFTRCLAVAIKAVADKKAEAQA
ncbi:MAG: 50S ribosomal protein L10 [Clostridia bacterium]|nr:50S ribosomal protein L10 [Clostridia bacterium]